MSMLKDALINLVNYFNVNKSDSDHSDNERKIKKEFFYNDFTIFETQFTQYLSMANHSEPDKVAEVVEDHQSAIHLKVPKICFPWYAFALCRTYKGFPKSENAKEFHIVNGQKLSLKFTRSDYPNEKEIIEKAQNDFHFFIRSLIDGDIYNKSLNLYFFNEATNLYDLFNLVDIFLIRSI